MSDHKENLSSFLDNPYTRAIGKSAMIVTIGLAGWLGNATYGRILDIYAAINDPTVGINARIAGLGSRVAVLEDGERRLAATDDQQNHDIDILKQR